jgi:hypothetical protein
VPRLSAMPARPLRVARLIRPTPSARLDPLGWYDAITSASGSGVMAARHNPTDIQAPPVPPHFSRASARDAATIR